MCTVNLSHKLQIVINWRQRLKGESILSSEQGSFKMLVWR